MIDDKLQTARAKVDEIKALIAADAAVIDNAQDEVAILQARIERLRAIHAAQGLREQLALANRELTIAEEAAVVALNIALAAEIIKRNAADPINDQHWIAEHVVKLRTSVRSRLDTPINEKYSLPPIITQALALLPPLDPIDIPVFQLGGAIGGSTDWTTRRRKILADAETHSPLEAA